MAAGFIPGFDFPQKVVIQDNIGSLAFLCHVVYAT
jgi:hypothetical protein